MTAREFIEDFDLEDMEVAFKSFAELKCKEQDRNTRHTSIETMLELCSEFSGKGHSFPDGFIDRLNKDLMNQKIKLPAL